MIKVKDLKFKYPVSNENILDIPFFELQKGEKVFLYGPSGCGKTTFLEILAGINIPSSGELEIRNQKISELTSTQRDEFRAHYMGYIFQSFNLIPYLTVEENITLPLYLSDVKRKKVPKDSEKNEVQRLCQFLGIEKYMTKPVTELSVGQQQRVAAARAILGKPDLILADEPTSSLDFNHREKFIKLLFELCTQNGTSILFVSHDRSLEKLFDRSLSLLDMNQSSFNSFEDKI
ncbi:MAG TPA: ABC transporter ATP-binding protein [Pseudobdellovibrionaceae bacterium]|nr:ABC transporter ATP-binding protein [Pseudobdellovibrionaceae bacterium]